MSLPQTDTKRKPTIKPALVNGRSLSLDISGHMIGQTWTGDDMLMIIHDVTEEELWGLADRMSEVAEDLLAAELKKKEANEEETDG